MGPETLLSRYVLDDVTECVQLEGLSHECVCCMSCYPLVLAVRVIYVYEVGMVGID